MEKEKRDFGIDESLYPKIKQAQTRDEILELFKNKEGFREDLIGLGCFNFALETKKDYKTADHLFNIFANDFEKLGQSRWTLFDAAFRLLKQPDIFVDDIVEREKDPDQRFYITNNERRNEIKYRSKFDDPVFIIGETGTGKGFLVKLIQKISDRRNEKFEQINCVALPKELLESELFGHEKGAFTGAIQKKKGILEIANNGTVFLDEIGKMPMDLQPKLLKAIEEGKIRPVGSEKEIDINVRFIVAAQPEDAKHIKPELRNRLGFPDFIEMPTLEQLLRSGRQLYIKIIEDSLNQAKKILRFNKDIKIRGDVYPLLLEHRYPGNFRELENILKSAIRSAEMNGRIEIQPQDLIEVLEKSTRFYEKDEEKSPSPDKTNLKNIKLKDIIDYAHQEKVRIIESKMNEVKNSGKDIKSVLMNEGLSEKEYLNFRKKVVTITGKRIKEFGL